MAAINAIASLGAQGGYTNPHVTVDLRSYGMFIGWPPAAPMDIGAAPATTVTRVSAAVHPRAINGAAGGSYADDYYDRIHIIPRQIDVGSLVTSQRRTVDVWNAWRTREETLTDVHAVDAGGIDITPPAPYPIRFTPLQLRTWQIQVTPNGAPSIRAALSWLFAGEQPITVHITGQRLTAWTVTPDWSRSGITETLAWLTDMQQAVNGSVLRTPLRETPRRMLEYDIVVDGTDRQQMESTLTAWRGRQWALPVWPDQSVLAAPLPAGSAALALATAGLDFSPGALAMLHHSAARYELVEIDTVEAARITFAHPTTHDWPAATRLWPVRLMRLTDSPKLQRLSAGALRSTLRFESTAPNTWPALSPDASYRGHPALEMRPDETGGVTVIPDRQLDEMDGDVGAVRVDDVTGLPWPTQTYTWWLPGRAVRARHRSTLYWLAGRANALWVPSYAADITLAGIVPASGTTLTVERAGFAQYAVGLPGRRHIRIERRDGAVFYRAVTAATLADDTTEQLSIDGSLGADLAPADVRQISWMMLAHLSRDDVEIDHMTDSEGLATCSATFRALPAEEPLA